MPPEGPAGPKDLNVRLIKCKIGKLTNLVPDNKTPIVPCLQIKDHVRLLPWHEACMIGLECITFMLYDD